MVGRSSRRIFAPVSYGQRFRNRMDVDRSGGRGILLVFRDPASAHLPVAERAARARQKLKEFPNHRLQPSTIEGLQGPLNRVARVYRDAMHELRARRGSQNSTGGIDNST